MVAMAQSTQIVFSFHTLQVLLLILQSMVSVWAKQSTSILKN
jgi:hypothetical protein